ncbi:hypothetical protein AWC38_SpisGene11966 [Stylophora pistillata]|uniref:Uncharacterized protein n=1 Tax=Stylophora pistillata TaxID=50429 RepID=A0A2B4S0Q1_STYPI|nr:hypothetical protein AWC38_SpisGene11966 [Stylophora pistillata]
MSGSQEAKREELEMDEANKEFRFFCKFRDPARKIETQTVRRLLKPFEWTFDDYDLLSDEEKRWAMCKPLPVRGFKWMSQGEIGDWRASERNIPCILEKHGDNAKLLFTDTDSLMYEMETEDFYKDIAADVDEKFDTSNFPKDHVSKIPTGCNKKVVGMMKVEAGGKIIEELVGLRAKLYSYKILEGKEEKCKGIKKTDKEEYNSGRLQKVLI